MPQTTIALLALFMTVAGGAAFAQPVAPAPQAVTVFESSTRDYAVMHRRLESQIGSIEFGTPIPEINRIIRELATAIRMERRDALQGDLFTPALAPVLRARIQDALLEHGLTADDVRADSRVAGIDYERVRLQVNDTFPWLLSATMFPCLIEALPTLPSELQYRMVDDALVLIDVHASLVVDVLPRALADLTVWHVRLPADSR
jgi:hypothetical protein